jgi:lipopolysaccharide biosynthesis glycosyltransferase
MARETARHEANDKRLFLVTIGDDSYAMPMAVALSSALRTLGAGWEPHLFVLSDGVSDDNKARIRRTLEATRPGVRLEFRNPDISRLDDVPITTWHSPAVFMKLFFPFELPQDAERAILLDGDTVVVKDLGELWTKPFEDRLVLATENFSGATMATGFPSLYGKLGLSPAAGYFNSGVFVANLPRWRSERVAQRSIELLATHQANFLDQDALNGVVAGDWSVLHPRWNVQLAYLHTFGADSYSPDERQRLREDMSGRPAVLHFVGPRKPWHWRYKGSSNEEFFRALKNSGWFAPPVYAAFAASRRLSHFLFRQLAAIKSAMLGKDGH